MTSHPNPNCILQRREVLKMMSKHIKNANGISVTAVIISMLIFSLTMHCATKKQETNRKKQMNFIQAERMLDFLQALADGNARPEHVDAVMKAEGTELIIAQLNLMRKATPDQYRRVLSGLMEGKFPDIEPVDSGERARGGVIGLQQIWQILQWGIENVHTLKDRIAALQNLDVYNNSLSLALKYLPEKVDMTPSLFIVMGGRAGAAALKGERIYFDILRMSMSRARKNEPLLVESELTDFFAHEMHHIGLGKIRERHNISRRLDVNDQRVFRILSGLVAEGSASYLVSGHRNIDDLGFTEDLKNPNEMLNKFEKAIHSIQSGEIKTDLDYQNVTGKFVGNAYHIGGSALLHVVDRVRGLDTVMEIISDPRKLLIEYNEAAGTLKPENASIYLFDNTLAEKAFEMGR